MKSNDLYEGAERVKCLKDRYLFPNETETVRAYNRRLLRAVYDNWLLPGITARQSLLWEKGPARTDFGLLDKFIQDVDGLGTPADVFFMHVTERAMVEGIHWVLVDKTAPKPLSGDAQPSEPFGIKPLVSDTLSRQQEEDMGIRPFFKAIPGWAVYDWAVGEDKQLDWAVIAQIRETKDGPGLACYRVPQRYVWTRARWDLYEEDPGASKKKGSNYLRRDDLGLGVGPWNWKSGGDHNLGSVPLVPFYGIFEQPYVGWPVTKDVLDHAILIYNKGSDRDTAEFKTNNPIPYIIGSKNPEKVSVTSDSGIFLPAAQGEPTPSIGYLQSNGAGIDSTRTSERDLISRVFQLQLQSMRKDTSQVQSGESLKVENKMFHTSIGSFAAHSEMSENRCWFFFDLWTLGQAPGADPFAGKVAYVKDFSSQLIEAAMITAYSTMVKDKQLSIETFLRLLVDNEVLPGDIDPIKEISRIETESLKLDLPAFNPGSAPAGPSVPGQPTPGSPAPQQGE
jgi:hypothetical protein